MQDFEIAVVKVSYDKDGKAVEAEFQPTMKINVDPSVLAQLTSLRGTQEKAIKDNASLLLGAWFEKTNEIELADRDEYVIESETLECSKWSNGNVKTCTIRFIFRKHNLN